MSVFLSSLYIYIIDDNYFNGNLIKKKIEEVKIPNSSIIVFPPTRMEEVLSEYQTDINDIFLFSTDLKGNRSFSLAKILRKHCKKCQIAFFGLNTSKIKAEKLNFISSIGIIDIDRCDVNDQVRKLLIEANNKKKEILQEKKIVPVKNKTELFFFDADCLNYITTIKGERNRIEIHQSKSVDYIHTAIKEVKQIDLPDYFLIFKFYIINTRQIKKISRSNNILCFYNGEQLETGNRICKAVVQKMLN